MTAQARGFDALVPSEYFKRWRQFWSVKEPVIRDSGLRVQIGEGWAVVTDVDGRVLENFHLDTAQYQIIERIEALIQEPV